MLEGIHWLGHASFRLEWGGLVIYLDPWKLKQAQPADLVLITHGHHDHYSPGDLARITTPQTELVAPHDVAAKLEGSVHAVAPGDSLTLHGVTIRAVPSYNTNKPNHPKAAGNVGYVLEYDGRTLYHGGDTDLIPEMDALRCDIALLPAGGKYTMDAREAAQAAARIQPKVVVPMHWGSVIGSEEEIERMRADLPPGIELAVLQPE